MHYNAAGIEISRKRGRIREVGLEYVETEIPNREAKALRPGFFESIAMSVTSRFLAVAEQLDVRGPYFAFPSFLNSVGWKMTVLSRDGYHGSTGDVRPIEREHLILPPVSLENGSVDLEAAFRPAFDVFWNVCGWSSSQSYDASGRYSGTWRDVY